MSKFIPADRDLEFLTKFYPSNYISSVRSETGLSVPETKPVPIEVLQLESMQAQVEEIAEQVEANVDKDALEDFALARNNIKALLSKINTAISAWTGIVSQSESPRALEVFGQTAQIGVEMNKELVMLHSMKDTIERLDKEREMPGPQTVNTTNTLVMTGSTSDLSALASAIIKQKAIESASR